MKFITSRELNNKVFGSKITFSSYGSTTMSEEEEKNLVENYSPSVEIGGKFSGKFKFDAGVITVDETSGDLIEFVKNSSKMKLNDSFMVSNSTNSESMVVASDATTIDSKMKVAEAAAILFENEIKKRVSDEIDRIKAEGPSSFDSDENKETEFTY